MGKKGEFMTYVSSKTSRRKYAIIGTVSLAGGFLNGLLGAAGGILIGLAAARLLSDTDNLLSDRRDIFANVQIAMICVSLVSLCIYSSRNQLTLASTSWLIIPAAIGGAVGSLILRKIKSATVGRIFAILVIWSGIKMITG